nr:hypothetical protein GCM10025730_43060 [Promicromonospora thailandica]
MGEVLAHPAPAGQRQPGTDGGGLDARQQRGVARAVDGVGAQHDDGAAVLARGVGRQVALGGGLGGPVRVEVAVGGGLGLGGGDARRARVVDAAGRDVHEPRLRERLAHGSRALDVDDPGPRVAAAVSHGRAAVHHGVHVLGAVLLGQRAVPEVPELVGDLREDLLGQAWHAPRERDDLVPVRREVPDDSTTDKP